MTLQEEITQLKQALALKDKQIADLIKFNDRLMTKLERKDG